jgi:hypothetical protein
MSQFHETTGLSGDTVERYNSAKQPVYLKTLSYVTVSQNNRPIWRHGQKVQFCKTSGLYEDTVYDTILQNNRPICRHGLKLQSRETTGLSGDTVER